MHKLSHWFVAILAGFALTACLGSDGADGLAYVSITATIAADNVAGEDAGFPSQGELMACEVYDGKVGTHTISWRQVTAPVANHSTELTVRAGEAGKSGGFDGSDGDDGLNTVTLLILHALGVTDVEYYSQAGNGAVCEP